MAAASDTTLVAKSSNCRFTPETAKPPPASESSITFWPPGPTSSMSMSAGTVWVRLLRVTCTRTTWPLTPETNRVEGYGVALVLSRMVIGAGLTKRVCAANGSLSVIVNTALGNVSTTPGVGLVNWRNTVLFGVKKRLSTSVMVKVLFDSPSRKSSVPLVPR